MAVVALKRNAQPLVSRDGSLAGRAYGRIKEMALMQKLRVGRTPVREALQRLAYDGLVTIMPYRGTMASGLDLSEFDQLMEARIPQEALAARLAAQRARPEQVAALRGLVASYDVAQLCAGPNIVELLRLDQGFHRAVSAMADNKFLTESLQHLRDLTWRFHVLLYRRVPPSPQDSFNNYQAIADAIAAGDVGLVARQIDSHFGDERRALFR
jgi:DNA-binding GntR family transcriptional regulator